MYQRSLAAAIAFSFINTNITTKNDCVDVMARGDITKDDVTDGERQTYSATATVVVKGAPFEYKTPELTATRADISFDVFLLGCVLDKNDKLIWDAKNDAQWVLDAGNTAPNILVYNGDQVLNDCDNDNPYTGGLTEEDDIILSKFIAQSLLSWTTEYDLNQVFADVAAQATTVSTLP